MLFRKCGFDIIAEVNAGLGLIFLLATPFGLLYALDRQSKFLSHRGRLKDIS